MIGLGDLVNEWGPEGPPEYTPTPLDTPSATRPRSTTSQQPSTALLYRRAQLMRAVRSAREFVPVGGRGGGRGGDGGDAGGQGGAGDDGQGGQGEGGLQGDDVWRAALAEEVERDLGVEGLTVSGLYQV